MSHWYEVWADDTGSPPYLLMVESLAAGFRVIDPQEGRRTIFEATTYDEVRLWLLEDEYTRVMGRIGDDEAD